MEVIAYDRTWYERYDRGSALDETKKYLEYAAALKLIRDLPHCGSSLDIGTATGRYMLAFRRLGYRACGIDVSHEAIEIARNNLSKVGADCFSIECMDAQQMSFPDAMFHLVSCMMGTLTHISNPGRALTEICRVLVPGGVVLLSNWQPQTTEVDFLTVNTDAHNSFLSEKSLSLKEMINLVNRAGLVPERRVPVVLLPTKMLKQLIDCCLDEPGGYLDRITALENQLRRLFPRLGGQILLLLARKPL